MEAKEKAKELIEKFIQENIPTYMTKHESKKCALICVDEMLELQSYKSSAKECLNHIKYWREVKKEIKNL